RLVADDLEGGDVGAFGPRVAPGQELAQGGPGPRLEAPRSLDPLPGVRVLPAARGLEAGHRIALFAHPLEAPLLAKIRLQALPQGQQVLDIGRRVGLLPRREGAAPPVVLLAVLATARA